MPEPFDPYHKWLGISPKDQPPNHYRLLAIDLFESDPDVIASAAHQRMVHVHSFQLGKNSDLSQQILNEIATAKVCLLDTGKKAEYDEWLRGQLASLGTQPALDEGGADVAAANLDLLSPLPDDLLPPLPPTFPLPPLPTLPTARRVADDDVNFDAIMRRASPIVPVHAAISPLAPKTHRSKRQITRPRSMLRVIGLAISGALGLGVAYWMSSYFISGDHKEVAQPEHNQSVRNTEAPVPGSPEEDQGSKSVVDTGAESPASRSPGPTKPIRQPSLSTVGTEPVIEAKPVVDTSPVDEKTPIEKTLSQEEEELKAASAAVKTPEDYQAVAEKGLALADRAIVEGNVDMARTAVRQSLSAARKADDTELAKRTTLLLIQLQKPLSDALKDEARQRLGSQSTDGTVAEKPGKDGWIVIFRSSNPSIWNSEVNEGKDNFAISLSKVPDGIKYLRMQAAGQKGEVIIPITKAQLTAKHGIVNYGWNGTNTPECNGRHLGIYCMRHQTAGAPDVNIIGDNPSNQGFKGFGFGHRAGIHDSQCYSWNEVPLPETVFEIAVKSRPLTEKEQRALLN